MISAAHTVFRPEPTSGFRWTIIRAFILPATLAIGALFSPQQAWATAAPTTTMLTVTSSGSEVTSVAAGTVVTLTATVISGSSPVNPGQVKFCDASAAHCEDSALLATAQLTPAGIATYKFRPGVGSHNYQAVFVGTNGYTKSSSASENLTVAGEYLTTTTIASSGSTGNYALTATVVGAGSATLSPSGKVSFLDTSNDNASLGTAALMEAPWMDFTATFTTDVGDGPKSAAVADFNGDGIPDLAFVNQFGNSVVILLGNGDGTFTMKSTPTVGGGPYSIAVADFNGDGIPDLVTVNDDNTLTVLLGNGDGTFATKYTSNVGTSLSVAVGDFNGDGIPDIAVALNLNSAVLVLLGKGDGTFPTEVSTNVDDNPYSVAVGDFNGDGIPDLATASADGTVTVLLGKGNGAFTIKSTPNIGVESFYVAVGDFNGDGIPDLVAADTGGSSVIVLLGNGDGTFTTRSTPTVGSAPYSVSTGDFNGDGITDLAVPGAGDGTITVLLGNGDGTFSTQSTLANSALGGPTFVAVGDFNGDGRPDLAPATFNDSGDDAMIVLLNQVAVATATLSSPSIPGSGIQQIVASYPGDANYSTSTSNSISLLAAQIATTLQLGSSANPSIYDNQITLTTTLSPYSLGTLNTNGETVTFYNGGTSIGTATLSSGVATLNIASLPIGADTLTATYSTDGNFSSSTSNTVSLTVSQIPTTLQLYSNPNPSMSGASVTLSAILSPDYSNGFSTSGETVTFYNGATVLGTGTINENAGGAASLTVTSLPNGIDKLTASYTSDGIFASATSNTVSQAVGVSFPPIPNFVVNVTTDTTTGVASNCTSMPAPNCSLRDALAAAFANGSGDITFDSKVFATAQTITLANGGLNIPPQTTITGPTTGSGATLSNRVTVSGGGPVFTVNQFVTNTAISGLTITDGNTGNEGGGILNNGALTVTNSTISGNSANGYMVQGGGIENFGTLALINSSVTGNSVSISTSGCSNCYVQSGGIDNGGTLTLTNSTVVGNSASINLFGYDGSITEIWAEGGGITNYGTLTMNNSTVAGNSVNAQGVVNNGNLYVVLQGGGILGGFSGANNIISGNGTNGSEDDCDGGCPTSGQNGNLVAAGVQLAPLGNYGGPTQTQPPLPGSTAICAGVVADIPAGVTTDQRGLPRTTTYGSNPPCVDSGAVQTNYSVSFTTEPPSTVPANIDFTAALQLSENGNPFPLSGFGIPIALAAGDNGALNVSSLSTNSSGVAGSSQLTVSAPGTGDMLVASFPLTASGVTPVGAASAKSTAFNVTPSTNVQVTIGSSPARIAIMVDGVSYSAPVTLTWTVGAQHTLSATSPQDISGVQYTFAAWSDGGAISHTVTASSATISYTVTFNFSGYLLTIAANPPQGGVVSPASGTFYPSNAVVNLTATPNPGYAFAGWTGNVASASNASTTITMSAPETVTANFELPAYIVTTNLDDATGTAANCTTPSQNCSLRDALAAAAATTSGANIEFDPTAFAASQPASARTIVLGSGGTLNVPANTTITGPTTGSGPTFTQLVTINGKDLAYSSIFSTGNNTALSGLVIADDPSGSGISNGSALMVTDCTISGNTGSGITNNGTLTVMGTAISGNSSGQGGGGILNEGSLTVIDSTISGNSATGTPLPGPAPSGGGIYNLYGTTTIIGSTISGNSNTGIVAWGGINQNVPPQFVTIANSTISGNTGGGINVEQGVDLNSNNPIPVPLTITDSVLSGNTTNGSEDDCDYSCPASGQNGNVVGPNALLAPLANYGGPTQTQPPLPGSPAICTGIAANLPGTDQRGFPRTTTYGSNPPCVDSGAVQTNYALSFSSEPPASVPPSVNFAAAIQLSESGNPFPVSGVSIPVALGSGDAGSLSVSSLSTNSSGIAGSGTLQVSAEGTGDTLLATLPLTTTPPPAPLTSTINISATSSAFNVGRIQQTITFAAPASPVSYGVSPIMLSATASSGLPVTFSILSGPATVSGNTLTITGVGMIVVAANQAGNSDYTAAPQVTQTIIVNKATPSLSLMVTPATPTYGTLVTFTGMSAPAGTTATNFSFLIDKGTANSAILPATIQTNHTVTATYGQLKAGAHTVELEFSGTANYAATASPSVAVNVTQATPAITWNPASSIPYGTSAASLLNATANTPGTFTYAAQKAGGSAISLTATTILAAGSYTLTTSFAPNDSVDYKSATQMASLSVTQKTLTATANNAMRVYGTANPSFTGTVTGAVNGDVFTETFTTTATTTSNAGNYAIVPSVTGADVADYTLVVDNGALTVTQAASATAITSSTVNANLNASVTFTATISSSTTGPPTGSVEFLNGSTVLGSAPLNNQGVATYMTSALPAGTDTINAVYAGNQNFTSSMATLMQQVTAPNFSLKSSATQLSLIGGDTGQLTITLTPVGGYTGMTSFSCAGLPQNATCSFNPPTLTADGSNSPASTTMTLTTDGSGSGTVGLLRPRSPGTPAPLASLAGLPACFAGLILFWQRKRLSPPVRRLFCAALLIGGLAGSVAISACGGSSKPTTPPGTSTVSVMATGSGNTAETIMITLTVTQ